LWILLGSFLCRVDYVAIEHMQSVLVGYLNTILNVSTAICTGLFQHLPIKDRPKAFTTLMIFGSANQGITKRMESINIRYSLALPSPSTTQEVGYGNIALT
jgi:hypothetical protein